MMFNENKSHENKSRKKYYVVAEINKEIINLVVKALNVTKLRSKVKEIYNGKVKSYTTEKPIKRLKVQTTKKNVEVSFEALMVHNGNSYQKCKTKRNRVHIR